MKLFHHEMTTFEFVKVGMGRLAAVGLIVASMFITLQILNTEKEMSTMRRGQLQLERVQSKLTSFSKPQTLITMPYHELRDLNSVIRDSQSVKMFGNSKAIQVIFDAFHDYIAGRGEMSSFSTMVEDISRDVVKINDAIKLAAPNLRGPEVVIAFSSIKKSFETIQNTTSKLDSKNVGHGQYVILGGMLTTVKEALASLNGAKGKSLEKSIKDFRAKFISPT